jgi:5-formyltetrahydrofolate cyclo-ligase
MERGSYTDVYWCRNWTFTVRKTADGEAYMYDTYFNNWDSAIRVTDDNINDFEVVFDFRNVERVPDSFRNEYEDDDLYYVATDSGGYSCGDLYWKDKNTKPSLKKQINKKRQAVKDAEYELEYAKRDLKSFVTENNINTNDYPEES